VRKLLPVVTLLVAAGASPAQVHIFGRNEGGNFQDNRSMGGPNLLLGMQFTALSSEIISRLEIFTGERTGTNSLALWTHNAGMNQPGTLIASGTWPMVSANSWQGVNLPLGGVPIVMGTTYWLVWGPINSSQASWDDQPGAAQTVYRGSFDGGTTWNGPFNGGWKFRLFAPRAITLTGTPQPGNTINLGLLMPKDAGLNYVMAASFSSVPGIPLAPDGRPIPLMPDAMMLLSLSAPAIFVSFSGVLDPMGAAAAQIVFPPVPALTGLSFFVAAVSTEAISSSGIKSITDPLPIVVQ
jgi:hypothetical protein